MAQDVPIAHVFDPSHLELLEHLEQLESLQLWPQSFALADELSIEKLLQFRQSGDLLNAFIVANSLDSSKA